VFAALRILATDGHVLQLLTPAQMAEVLVSDKPTLLGEAHALYWSSWPYVMVALGIVIALAYAVRGRPFMTLGGLCATFWGLSDLAERRGRGGRLSRAVRIVCGTLTLLIFFAYLLAPLHNTWIR